MVGKNYDRLVLLIQCSAVVVEINVDNLTGVNICAKKLSRFSVSQAVLNL